MRLRRRTLPARTRKAWAKVKVKNQGGLGGEGKFQPALLRKAGWNFPAPSTLSGQQGYQVGKASALTG